MYMYIHGHSYLDHDLYQNPDKFHTGSGVDCLCKQEVNCWCSSIRIFGEEGSVELFALILGKCVMILF